MTGFALARAVSRDAGVERVLVNGVDVTWFRCTGMGPFQSIRPSGYMLLEPFAYGASQPLTIYRTNSNFEPYGAGDLAWLKKGARVEYQRVYNAGTEDETIVTDWRGFITTIRATEREWVAEVAGELTGKASLLNRPQQIIRKRFDIGSKVTFTMEGMGFHLAERFPEVGIDYVEAGGTTQLALLQTLCALTRTEDSQQWSIMPTVWGGNTWSFAEKDVTTKDFTVFADGARIVLDLVDDLSEQPNTIFGNGVGRDGERWRNARWPGLFQGTPAGYPFVDHSHNFGIGTTDDDTDTEFGISVLVHKLTYLDDGLANLTTYTSAVARAVKRLQADAGLPQTGIMTYEAWQALWNTDAVGFDTDGARIFPLYQHPSVNRYRYSASGDLVGRNPDYVEGTRRVDRSIDFGLCEQEVAARYARNLVNTLAGNQFTGTITLNNIGVFSGQRNSAYADAVNADPASYADDMLVARDIRPGMNAWLPYFNGGTLLHVAGVNVTDTTTTLTVSSAALDIFDITQAMQNNAESQRNVYREWRHDNIGPGVSRAMVSSDKDFGWLRQNVSLVGGQWNLIEIVIGQSGTVGRAQLELDTATEFSWAFFDIKVTEHWMNSVVGNPFVRDGEGRNVWQQPGMQTHIKNRDLRMAQGDADQSCGFGWMLGYDSDHNRTAADLDGTFISDASWVYGTNPESPPIGYLMIYPLVDCELKRGHLFWALLDDVT